MFSGGSVKVLGIFFAMGSVLLAVLAFYLGEDQKEMSWGMLGFAVVQAVIASACLFETGRAVTGRITAAIGVVVCLGLFIGGMLNLFDPQTTEVQLTDDTAVRLKQRPLGMMFCVGIVGVGAAYYAVYGRFPEKWTFDELFRWPDATSSKRKPKSNALRKQKKRKRELSDE